MTLYVYKVMLTSSLFKIFLLPPKENPYTMQLFFVFFFAECQVICTNLLLPL